MTEYTPLVSIVIPVFNGSNYLREAIESALSQTYQNIEILVVNDGSDDDGKTRDIALSYNDRIRYFEKENGGVASALNLGIEKMEGEYFSWLSHDDVYLPNKVEVQVQRISRDVIIFSDFKFIDSHGQITGQSGIDSISDPVWVDLFAAYPINGCTILIHKKCFDNTGFFDTSLIVSQDYDMWFRLAANYSFEFLPISLVYSRRHSEQNGHYLHYDPHNEMMNMYARNIRRYKDKIDKIKFTQKKAIISGLYLKSQYKVCIIFVREHILKVNSSEKLWLFTILVKSLFFWLRVSLIRFRDHVYSHKT